MPFYDSDLDLLWIGCRGDKIIKNYEYTKTGKLNLLNDYNSGASNQVIYFN